MKDSSNTNAKAIHRFKQQQQKEMTVAQMTDDIIAQNITALSRGITLLENMQQHHIQKAQQLIENCLPHSGKSIRIGITGVPGVGKSTFIEALGNALIRMGKKVAVLAVDPSSTISGGSILGDKTRMESLVRSPHAFIRPSPSGAALGGVAQKTREAIILCEAAGFDVVLIETVGVGQNEFAVRSMVDFFLLLNLTGAGDELQGIKKGILEMVDAVVITKADGTNLKPALVTQQQLSNIMHLHTNSKSDFPVQVITCSVKKNTGILEIWELVEKFVKVTSENGFFEKNRIEQHEFWLFQTIEEQLKKNFYDNDAIKKILPEQIKAIQERKITPFAAAAYLLEIVAKQHL